MRVSPAQFSILVSFMEEHGDLMKPSQAGPYGRIYAMRKWVELVDLLNDKSVGEGRSISRWKKCWSDLKNNTKKKEKKVKRIESVSKLSDMEKRILKVIEKSKEIKETDDYKSVLLMMEVETNPTIQKTSSPSPYFAEVDGEPPRQRMSTESSLTSISTSSQTPEKQKRPAQDNIRVMTNRYLEFERERERMAHEREMARINQNDKFITIFGRMANVLETLAPSIQRYLDYKSDGNG